MSRTDLLPTTLEGKKDKLTGKKYHNHLDVILEIDDVEKALRAYALAATEDFGKFLKDNPHLTT